MDIVWQLAASLLLGTSRVLDTLCTSINRSVAPQPNSCFTDSNFRAYIMQQPSKKFWVADCNMCTFAASALSHAHVQTEFNFWSVQSLSHVRLFGTPWTTAHRHPCPSPPPRVHPNPCPLSRWCHPPSHPLSFPSPPALNLSQHQGLFQWVSSLHQVTKVLEFQLQHQSFQWIFRTDFLNDGLIGSPYSSRDSQDSSSTPQFKSINSSVLSFLYSPTFTSIHGHWKNHSLD